MTTELKRANEQIDYLAQTLEATIKELGATRAKTEKYKREVIQLVVDLLTAVNLIAETGKRSLALPGSKLHYSDVEAYNTLIKIQDINKNLMAKIREMERQ